MVAWSYRFVEPQVQSLDLVVVTVDSPSLSGSEELGGQSVFEKLEMSPYCVEPDAPSPRVRSPTGSEPAKFAFGICCGGSKGKDSDREDEEDAANSKTSALEKCLAGANNLAVGVVARGQDFQAKPQTANHTDAHALFSILTTDGSPGVYVLPLAELVRRCRVSWHPLTERLRPKGQDLARALSDIANFWSARDNKPLGVALVNSNAANGGNRFGEIPDRKSAEFASDVWRPFLGPSGGAKVVFTSDLPKLATRFVGEEKLPGKAVVSDLDRVKRTSSALRPVLTPSPFVDPEPLSLPGSQTEFNVRQLPPLQNRIQTADLRGTTSTYARFGEANEKKNSVTGKRKTFDVRSTSSCPSLDSLKRLCTESFAGHFDAAQRVVSKCIPIVEELDPRRTYPSKEEEKHRAEISSNDLPSSSSNINCSSDDEEEEDNCGLETMKLNK